MSCLLLRLQIELVVSASSVVVASDGHDLFDYLASQVVVYQVSLAFKSDEDGIGAIEWHYLGD